MENDLPTAAAAVSYFSMLAMFPALLLLLSIGNRWLEEQAVERYVISQLLTFLPGGERLVGQSLESITALSGGIVFSCVFVMLWATSWMFTAIEKALNRIWGTYPRSFLHGRAVNMAVMSLIWLLLGGLALFTAFVTSAQAAAARLPVTAGPLIVRLSGIAWQSIFVVASLIVTVVLFTLLYKILPNTHVPLTEALPGAMIAGGLWEGAKFGVSLLLPYFHYDLLYGSLGAVVALITWVYLSSLIMLFGAQFTALVHREHLFNAVIQKGHHPIADNS